MDRGDSPTEPSINDLELWLEHQAELGTPSWWGELEAIPGITDPSKFAWKIQCILLCTRSLVQDVPGPGVFHTSGSQEFE